VAEPHSFGRYRVTGTLGSGAMGEVFAATDDVLGREVAIKTLRSGANSAAFLDERFRQEARAIGALAHPNVVQVFDIDVAAEQPYIVMERVTGPSLKDRLAHGPLAPDEVRALGIQIARALAAAHAAGIVHRDVKPANILGAGAGRWKLADFGVAHVPDSSLTMTGQFVGSPAYAAPEALVAGKTGPACDVFSLGATLYEAAAGTWPRSSSAGLLAPAPPLRERTTAIPFDVASAVDRAVAIEADKRPSAEELANLLAGTAAAPPRAIRWKPWAITGAVAAAMIVVAVAATRGGGKTRETPSTPPAPALAPEDPRTPEELDEKRAKEWNKIVDEIHKGHLEGARKKLDDWERKFGPTAESADLRSQLEAAMPGEPRPDMTGDELRDWEHVIEEARRGHIEPARHKLEEWETKYGSTPESAALRSQLDGLGPSGHRRR
jgi:serine/threonine protein kinase